MAKRKRLTPAEINALSPGTTPAPEVKSMGAGPLGVPGGLTARPPIAQVAGAAATQAALDEVADELRDARQQGRMVLDIALERIDADHLVRDRMPHTASDPDMAELLASLRARGQQTPIEVIELEQGRYGLVSGWRRLSAFRTLQQEAQDPGFAKIKCLIRQIDTATDAYIAMVEENEIRTNLSFYERARLAAEAARIGLYGSVNMAVSALFASASAAKRSKINSFVVVYHGIGSGLKFPTAIPERLGLGLAGAIDKDPTFAPRLRDRLRKADVRDAAGERATLERSLRKTPAAKPSPPKKSEIKPGLFLQAAQGKVTLSGKAVTQELQSDLIKWLREKG